MTIPKADRELMRGVIDMHLHTGPCLLDRPFDDIEAARQAREVGYRGLVAKSIFVNNADRIELVRRMVPGIELFGGVTLNHTVGGVNPLAVRSAIGFGAKVVWFPTVHSNNHVQYFGVATYPWVKHPRIRKVSEREVTPIRLIDDNGRLLPEATEVLELAADAGLVVGTGHIGAEEIFAVLGRAREIGLDKVVCTHVGWHATNWSDDEIKRMADMGGYLEFTVNPCMPARQQSKPKEFAQRVLSIGSERCIAATDLGQPDTSHFIDGFRMFLRMLMSNGLSENDIDMVARRNPARLLDLPEEWDAGTRPADVDRDGIGMLQARSA